MFINQEQRHGKFVWSAECAKALRSVVKELKENSVLHNCVFGEGELVVESDASWRLVTLTYTPFLISERVFCVKFQTFLYLMLVLVQYFINEKMTKNS